jgi:hypothetical protein
MIDPHVWLSGLIGAIVHSCPPHVKYRVQCTGRSEDDLAQQVRLRLIERNGNPKKDNLGWEELAELAEKAMAAGVGFIETEAYQRIRSIVFREVYRRANGSTAGKRPQRGLPQEVPFPDNFDPADQHGSRGNHHPKKEQKGGKRWNGKPYDSASRPESAMAIEFLVDMEIEFSQGFGDFSERELEILRGSMGGKTDRELGKELGISKSRASEIRVQVIEKLKMLCS